MKNFSSILDLCRYFNDQKTCWSYLEKLRWNGEPECLHCLSKKKIYRYSSGKNFKCSECKRQFSITKGTIFERSKIDLVD